MPRCKKRRRLRQLDDKKIFKPIQIKMRELEQIEIGADEFEAIRLCDLDGFNQIEAGEKMEVSRGTIQRLLISGRKKLVSGLLNDNVIVIDNENK